MAAQVTLTNPTHLIFLLAVGNAWQHPLALRFAITRTTPPESTNAPETLDLTVTAQERLDSFQHPQLHVEMDFDIYDAPGPVNHLWTGVYHMIEEREERGIFGSHYADKRTLQEKLGAMLDDFNAGRSVYFYLSELFIGDEFSCYGVTPTPLADGIQKICELAGGLISPTDTFQTEQREEGPQHQHIVNVYESELTVNSKLSSVNLSDAEDVDSEVAKAAADLLIKKSMSETFAEPDGDSGRPAEVFIPKWVDRYAWQYPASKLAESATTPLQHFGVRHYAKLAGAVMKNAAQRSKSLIANEGIAREDTLQWVAKHVGKREAVLMAAVEGEGGVMRGIRDLSYSSFTVDGEGGDSTEYISLAATASDLRDVGRLGWEDNVLEAGAAAGPAVSTRLVVRDDTEDSLITVPIAEGKKLEECLPGDAVVL